MMQVSYVETLQETGEGRQLPPGNTTVNSDVKA